MDSDEMFCTVEFLRSFLRRHFPRKPVVVSQNAPVSSVYRLKENNIILIPG